VRFVKLAAAPDNQVTLIWVDYERSQESDGLQNFLDDSDVNIKINTSGIIANDMNQASFDFHVETLVEQNDTQDCANLPDNQPADTEDPDMGPTEDWIQIDSHSLEGAKVIYVSSEERTPAFGPMNEMSPLNMSGSGAVGVPMKLQPPTVFEVRVRIFIPCSGYIVVSGLNVFYCDGNNWVLTVDAAGNVKPGGDG
jgi:hypothetical protein